MSRAELLESLEAVGDCVGVYFDDGRYLDWSGDCLEVGNLEENDGDAIQIETSRADLERIHAALTRHLLMTAE